MTVLEKILERMVMEELGTLNPDSLVAQKMRRTVLKVANYYEGKLYDKDAEIHNLKGELGWIKEGKGYVPWGATYAEPQPPQEGEPRQYTPEEIRENFLRHVRDMILYWHKPEYSKTHALEGLAHSILVALDGESAELPSFVVLPLSNIEDYEFYRENGLNWYPLLQFDNPYDIAGSLHDHLFKSEPKKEEKL